LHNTSSSYDFFVNKTIFKNTLELDMILKIFP
jgi:hypothetical protein